MNYSFNIVVPSLVLVLCQLFTFAHNMRYCFTFLVTHSTIWLLGCFNYLVFHIVRSNCLLLSCTQHGFYFNFQVSFSYPLPCFFFICSFWHFSYKLTIHYFVFSYFLFFPHLTLFEFLLIHCILIFCCFCIFRIFNQWLN